MERDQVEQLMEAVARGEVTPGEAVGRLAALPVAEVPEAQATLDTHRALRTGDAEVVLGGAKTVAQLVPIVLELSRHHRAVLVTRVDDERARALDAALPEGRHDPVSRTWLWEKGPRPAPRGRPVVVVTAGTSDAPVAEEAALAAELAGVQVERVHDVGVAGLHRVARHHGTLARAGVIVVVAGMEGALPSVVAGLAGRPVIAVPTSVGYGAAFGGLAALLGMLNSCAPGVSVVNIDNGFGAGRLAAMLAREMA